MSRILVVAILLLSVFPSGAEVSYNKDVLPILASKCFTCHGTDAAERKADLRLDESESAYAEREGVRALVPGNLEESALIERILTDDKDDVMPPVKENTPLTDEEKETLRQWVKEGAKYERHWAFITPKKPEVPKGESGVHAIDAFVRTRLIEEKLPPQKEASRADWLRRVSFDLTGLPPSLEELEAFLKDESEDAHEKVVDRLLASPRYGERMAIWWLDGARYGDSHGYDNDLESSQWPWRNWVIEAFNANMPYDQFTLEQLAGDLLPNPTESQILATGFNRNHRIQTEGGAIDEEWRTEYVMDRVETMGAVWLGLTLSCARCHDHKYDPISQKEFYQLFSLFNNLDEKGFINNLRGAAEPRIRYKAKEFEAESKKIAESELSKGDKEKRQKELEERHPSVMIMREMEKPRQAHVLKRGQYDAKGDKVDPGLPQAFSKTPEGPITRLNLAQWMIDEKHPLTARVVVNRLWEQIFGTGLVESSENLGVQTDWPSHPELLDWLAVDFMESGWDIKRLLKAMVLSKTYRQSDAVREDHLLKDPNNRLLARGPRTRLQAEMVRDQALFVSGLLIERLGGPSWWVYQPAGLWLEVEKRGTFKQDHGEKLYRRSIYSRIRRTVAPPSMRIFDMPSREMCTVKRPSTNTPMQALALMNEVTYVEAAKRFGERMMTKGGTPAERIAWGFKTATMRDATADEMKILVGGYERRLARYQKNKKAAEDLLAQGESKVAAYFDKPQLAAMATVANVILNLDELINK